MEEIPLPASSPVGSPAGRLGKRKSEWKSRRSIFLVALLAGSQVTFWVWGIGTGISITGVDEATNQLKTTFGAPVERIPKRMMRQPSTNSSLPPIPEARKEKQRLHIIRRLPNALDDCFQKHHMYDFPKSGCTVNSGRRAHCQFNNVRFNPSKVTSQNRGGEPLNSVMGQPEEAEYLSYEPGAFTVPSSELRQKPSEMGEQFFYLIDVFNSFQTHNEDDSACSIVWKGTTLFLTRYEYVNMFHTSTDWWNTFFSIPVRKTTNWWNKFFSILVRKHGMYEGVLDLPINIAFLDSHPQGNLDVVWKDLLGGQVVYARHLSDKNETRSVCFETARFVPAGYSSALVPGQGSDKCPSDVQAADYMNFFLSIYGLQDVRRIPGHVVAIDRVPYIAHPRSNANMAERTLSNLKEIASSLPAQFAGKYKTNVTVEVVTLSDQDMREQIRSIRQADFLIANHGAGMAHELFMDEGAHVLEMSCSRKFFVWLAEWKPIQHHCLPTLEEEISPKYWQDNVVSVIDSVLSAREAN